MGEWEVAPYDCASGDTGWKPKMGSRKGMNDFKRMRVNFRRQEKYGFDEDQDPMEEMHNERLH